MTSSPSMRLPNRPRKAIYGLVVVAALLAVCEIAVRGVWSKEELLFSWEKEASPVMMDHDNLPLSRPNQDLRFQDGPYAWVAHQNGQGLREQEETPRESPAEKKRWLALGDSWVWGHSTTDGKTFIDRLEFHTGLDIVNAGIIGSSGWDILQRWREFEEYAFDGVLLLTPHNLPRQQEIAPWRNAPYSVDNPPLDWRTRLLLRQRILPWRMAQQPKVVPSNEAMVQDLQTVSTEAQAHGMRVVLVISPRQQDTRLWQQTFDALGVPTTGHLLEERSCYGFVDTWHPSEAGADALAQAVAPALIGSPPSTTIPNSPSCMDTDGIGPGKPGWEWQEKTGAPSTPLGAPVPTLPTAPGL